MPTAGGAIFGGDVNVEGFALFANDAVVNAGVGVHEGLGRGRCEEGYPHGFGGSQGVVGFMLDKVDSFYVRMDQLEVVTEVFTGFRKGARVLSLPEEEKAIRQVIDKNGGFICLSWRRQELEVITGELGQEVGMGDDFVHVGTGVKGEDNKVRVTFGGKKVLAVYFQFCRKPGGYNAASLKDWSRVNAGVVIFEFKLFLIDFSSCHGNDVLAMGVLGHSQDRGQIGCVGTFMGELNFTKII